MDKRIVFLFIFLVCCCLRTFAQRPVEITPATDTVQVVDILHADRLGFSKRDTANIVQYAAGKVAARQGTTLFYSDSAVLNEKVRIFEAFGNVHINDNDSTHTYSQYLRYYFDKKFAILQKNVRLTDGKSVLTTQELEYDLNQKVGIYKKGGKVANGESVLTSTEGTYYDDLKDVFFRKNVVLVDPKYKLYADSLLYNTESEIATFIGPTTIIDSSGRKIVTSEGFYDTKNRIANFLGRPVIRDPKNRTYITGNELFTDDKTGISTVRGNGVYIDSAQGVSMIANSMIHDRNNNTLLATMNPLMIIKQEDDSIYVTADTLFSGPLKDSLGIDSAMAKDTLRGVNVVKNNEDTVIRFFQGYHNVRIFSDSLQAVSDSLYWSGRDSIFRLFRDPIVWANQNQITGDTIYLYTKNKKAERLYVFENGMVVSKSDNNLYNQIRGNTLNGYFKDGVMDFMKAKGNAESIYYIRDEDSAYIGVNRSTADVIDMFFKDKELNRVVYRNEVQGTTIPFRQINFDEMRLRNFKWLDDRRPKSKFELFGN
ncbi:MAG TPA: OstA-like protein [Chitinophagaceae bacterium]|nr:OstA-like protein [Chitinophagaceae bacterium]